VRIVVQTRCISGVGTPHTCELELCLEAIRIQTDNRSTVNAQSTIQIRIHNANRNDRFDEGFMGLIHLPLDGLVTAVQTKPQTVELSNNFFKGTDSKGMLTFTIHWCTTAQFIRQQTGLFSGHWARKDTADGRFLFEDLEARDIGPSSRTAIVERKKDSLNPTPTRLRITKPR
jgi:hypothetical protein